MRSSVLSRASTTTALLAAALIFLIKLLPTDALKPRKQPSAALPISGFIIATTAPSDATTNAPDSSPSVAPSREGGKVKGDSGSIDTIFRVYKKVHGAIHCNEVEFKNLPVPNPSPLMGPPVFKLVEGALYNDRRAWSNGMETISFAYTDNTGQGNWLIGGVPGQDSGYVHIKGGNSIVPSGIESAVMGQENEWHWLMRGSWQRQPQLRLVCNDKLPSPPHISSTSTSTSSQRDGLERDTENDPELTDGPSSGEDSAFKGALHADYYIVEYIDSAAHLVHPSLLMPDVGSLLQQIDPRSPNFSPAVVADAANPQTYSFINKTTMQWQGVQKLHTLAEFGTPSVLIDQKSQKSTLAVLVNAELGSSDGYRLTFKKYGLQQVADAKQTIDFRAVSAKFGSLNPLSVTAHSSGYPDKGASSGGMDDMQEMEVKADGSPESSDLPLKTEQIIDFLSLSDDELFFETDNSGQYVGSDVVAYTVEPLKPSMRKNFLISQNSAIESTQPGDYLWFWISEKGTAGQERASSVREALVQCVSRAILPPSLSIPLSADPAAVAAAGSEAASKAVKGSKLVLMFRVFSDSRVETMRESTLHAVSELLSVTLPSPLSTPSNPSKGGAKPFYVSPILSLTNHAGGAGVAKTGETYVDHYTLHSTFYLGDVRDTVQYIRRYIYWKERKLGSLSSCYFYHAAVSLPQPLLYAAELLCVLEGAKPVVMVQFTTPSDHQWKFPLVRELSRAVIAAIHTYNSPDHFYDSAAVVEGEGAAVETGYSPTGQLLGNGMNISYAVFKYRKDETLVFYQTSRAHIAEALLPRVVLPEGTKPHLPASAGLRLDGQAQALHPAPYPDSNDPDPRARYQDYAEQIYNAYWNGYLLGYPEYFVRSYCETFHNNELNPRQRQQEMEKAAREVREYLRSIKQQQQQQPREEEDEGEGELRSEIGLGLDFAVPDHVMQTILESLRVNV